MTDAEFWALDVSALNRPFEIDYGSYRGVCKKVGKMRYGDRDSFFQGKRTYTQFGAHLPEMQDFAIHEEFGLLPDYLKQIYLRLRLLGYSSDAAFCGVYTDTTIADRLDAAAAHDATHASAMPVDPLERKESAKFPSLQGSFPF